MPNLDKTALVETCDKLMQEINKQIVWATHPLNLEPENEASILYNLKKHRRATKRYLEAIGRRHSVAIFGQSQVGKSYLVSNLAKIPESHKVELFVPAAGDVTPRWADFIEEINPPGGKESTGAVTRFTVVNEHRQGLQPFLLRLFNQSEVVKVLAHGYLSNITNYTYKMESETFYEKVNQVAGLKQATPQVGFTEDDVHELQDYIMAQFPDHFLVKDLARIGYWTELPKIIPYLPWNERFKLLSILWGEHDFFNDVFFQLSQNLAGIGFLTEVRVEEKALLPKGYGSPEHGWITDTIIDVQMVMQMYNTNIPRKQIMVCGKDNIPKPIDKNCLTALVSEIVLVIPAKVAEHPERTFFKDADVLDFPGAKSYKDMSEATFVSNTPNEKIEIFLRGKVAYLFEKYTYEYQINTLIYCLHNDPPEVKQVPHLLVRWLHGMHGKDANKRRERESMLKKLVNKEQVNPLLWVMTKFNVEIDGKPNEIIGKPETHDAKWSARINSNFVEYYNNTVLDKWARNWDGERDAFKNVFWLRDPKFPGKVYGKDDANKENIRNEEKLRIDDMHHSFTSNMYIKKHMHNPDEAWQETVPAGKSGIDYIVKYLTPTCDGRIKSLQIHEAIIDLTEQTHSELANFYDKNDPADKLKKAKENNMKFQLMFNRSKGKDSDKPDTRSNFGLFLDKIFIGNKDAYEIYFNLMSDPAHQKLDGNNLETGSATKKTISTKLKDELGQFITITEHDDENTVIQKLVENFGVDVETVRNELKDFDIDISELFVVKPDEIHFDISEIFAQKVIAKWLEHLRSIDKSNLEALGIKTDLFKIMIDEYDNTRKRINLKNKLADDVKTSIYQFSPNNENYNLVASLITSKLNNFIATFGYSEIDIAERPNRKDDTGTKIFHYQGLRSPSKDNIKIGKDNAPRPDKYLFDDFLDSLNGALIANATQGVTIKNLEQNRILGEILQKIISVAEEAKA